MTEEQLDLISAALDGDSVDERALARALRAPGAIDTVVDFLLLRAATNSVRLQPPSVVLPGRTRPSARVRPRLVWALAATLLFAAAGVWHYVHVDAPGETWRPPHTERVVHLEAGRNWGFVRE